MKSVVQAEFVKAIKKAIIDKEMSVMKFQKDRVVSILSDILCLGKEAVYRRLRGDVKFSLDEVALIALKLDISIDPILGRKDKEKSVIDLNLVNPQEDFRKKYQKKLNDYVRILETMNTKYGGVSILAAFNRLPYSFYLHHEHLAKFRLFKWAYQMRAIENVTFKDFVVSEGTCQAQTRLISELRKTKSLAVVFTNNIFKTFLDEVYYFYKLNLIDSDNLHMIKDELNETLKEVETMAITGTFGDEAAIELYLSDLDINYSSMLFKYDKHCFSYMNVYELGGIESQNKSLCEYQAEWISALKRYSKLITASNELERHRFFEEQRQILK